MYCQTDTEKADYFIWNCQSGQEVFGKSFGRCLVHLFKKKKKNNKKTKQKKKTNTFSMKENKLDLLEEGVLF